MKKATQETLNELHNFHPCLQLSSLNEDKPGSQQNTQDLPVRYLQGPWPLFFA